jgi:antitoxin component YwqK of YwqJK toxin-antitoxin module
MQNKNEYKNGQKVFEQKGNTLTYFFKTGILKAKGKSIHNKMEGKWIFNRESGDLWQIGNFKNDKKHGQWIRYDKTGKVEYDADFENGKLIKKRK